MNLAHPAIPGFGYSVLYEIEYGALSERELSGRKSRQKFKYDETEV